jgi:hypothetical protein
MKTIELDEEHALAIFWFLGHFQDGDAYQHHTFEDPKTHHWTLDETIKALREKLEK